MTSITRAVLGLPLLMLALLLSLAAVHVEGDVSSNNSSEASGSLRGSKQDAKMVLPTSMSAEEASVSETAHGNLSVAAPSSLDVSLGKNGSSWHDEVQAALASGDRCSSQETPLGSKCTGCPPMYNGKLCASTTWYEDRTKGSCGCGSTEMVAFDYWTLTSFTAALNTVSLDPQDPANGYCLSGCGSCYELCTTGGVINSQDTPTASEQCTVFKITNRCADGWQEGVPDWCSQHLSWQDCQANPEKCRQPGGTNIFGYSAHFDLQDAHRQVQDTLGWMNPEVTFEPVSCDKWQGPLEAECPGCPR